MLKSTRQFRFLALTCHLGLLAWMTIWLYVLRVDQPYSGLFVFLVYLLPLLLPLPGIIRGKPYTHAWANFIVLFYVLHGLTIIYAEPQEWIYAVIELVLATGMFTGCAVYARKRGKELGQGLKKLKTVMEEERQRFEG